jgi:hypothetical protein
MDHLSSTPTYLACLIGTRWVSAPNWTWTVLCEGVEAIRNAILLHARGRGIPCKFWSCTHISRTELTQDSPKLLPERRRAFPRITLNKIYRSCSGESGSDGSGHSKSLFSTAILSSFVEPNTLTGTSFSAEFIVFNQDVPAMQRFGSKAHLSSNAGRRCFKHGCT